MSVVEKNAIYKIQWQITGQDDKSGEIRLENKMCCLAVRSFSSFHQILYLVCKSADAYSATEISEVFFSTCSTPLDQRKQMIQKTGDRSHQIFSYEIITEWKTPLTLTLWVTIRESVDGYSFRLGDSLLTDQLWKSAKSQQFTDVEFRVRLAGTSSSEGTSYKSFTAHRCILAARSPVLAAIVGKSDSSTVDVDNVDPAAFRDLLHFIYTGQLDATSSNISQLQSLADRYEIPTLQKLLRTPVKELNASELTSLIMSSQPFFYPDINTKQDLNSSQGRSPMLLFGPEIHSTGIGSPADDGKHVATQLFGVDTVKKTVCTSTFPPRRFSDISNIRSNSNKGKTTTGPLVLTKNAETTFPIITPPLSSSSYKFDFAQKQPAFSVPPLEDAKTTTTSTFPIPSSSVGTLASSCTLEADNKEEGTKGSTFTKNNGFATRRR